MTRIKGIAKEIAGSVRQIAGEIRGDHDLNEEGKAQEREGKQQKEGSGGLKPLGNLDRLT
jgi:uncharacterized protein YjbJ (UPF0337 family)